MSEASSGGGVEELADGREAEGDRDSRGRVVLRRTLSIGIVAALFAVTLASAPVWLPAAWIFDRLHRGHRSALACGLFLLWYLGCELYGVAACAWLWLRLRHDPPRFLRRNFELQCRWADLLWRGAARLFGMSMELENDDCLQPGRYVLLCRHATIVDVLVPSLGASVRHGIRLRYVLKRELLWDPALDIAGNRLPNAFVDRGGSDSKRELARLRCLARKLEPDEGLMIFPEGTRFTEARRERLLQRSRAAGDREREAQVEAFRNVLPPRLGGSLALLDAASGADVVFCAHAGIDHLRSFWELWRGGLRGAVLRARFWRVPAAEVPPTGPARAAWLLERWREVDAWVGAHGVQRPPSPS